MKVLSGALVALFVSAPAFASVMVSVSKKAVALDVVTSKSTGDVVINEIMDDGRIIQVGTSTEEQIKSDVPVDKVLFNDGDYDSEQYEVGPSTYDGGGSWETIEKHDTIIRRGYRAPSGTTAPVVQNRVRQRNQFGAPSFGGPVYGGPAYGGPAYGGPAYGGPGYGGPGYDPRYRRPLPPITRGPSPYDGYGNPNY